MPAYSSFQQTASRRRLQGQNIYSISATFPITYDGIPSGPFRRVLEIGEREPMALSAAVHLSRVQCVSTLIAQLTDKVLQAFRCPLGPRCN